MKKEDKGKVEIYSDEMILEALEKRKLETEALRKILNAFDKKQNKKKEEV